MAQQSPQPAVSEGTIDFQVGNETYKTWYQVVGDMQGSTRRPLVTLHGGPGATHYYLASVSDLASSYNIPVIFYDQLGCGKSTHLREKGKEFWTPELFMDELDNLLAHFGIQGDFDLFGHSWGGMLGSQYAATRRPEGLKNLVISDSPASMDLWEQECAKLIQGLPIDVQETLKKHEDSGTTDSKEYQEAMDVFYAKHLCRVQPFPEMVQKTFASIEEDPTVYHTM